MSLLSSRDLKAPPARWSDWPYGIQVAVVALLYFLLARVGLIFSSVAPSVSPVWPPSGLAMGALIVGGWRLWPGVAIGALAGALSVKAPLVGALAVAVGNTAEPLITLLLLRNLFEYRGNFDRPRHVIGFIMLFALAGAPVSALFGVGGLYFSGAVPEADLGAAMLTWWSGNFTGGVVLAPALIAMDQSMFRTENASRLRELAGSLVLLLIVGMALFFIGGPAIDERLRASLTFLPFPILIWVAWSFGIGGAALGTLLLSSVAIVATTTGHGPFATHAGLGIGLLQVFIAIVALTSLVLAAFNAQRERVVERLRQREWQLTEAQRIGNLGVWMWDLRDEHFRLSDGGLRILAETRQRFSPSVGAFVSRIHPEDQAAVEETLRRVRLHDRTETFDCRIVRPDGEVRFLNATGALLRDHRGEPALLLGTLFDITDRKRLEAEQAGLHRRLLETQKLESLGVLAGGIAHDFNNLLTGILGNASLLRVQLPEDSPMIEGLRRIESASERAADLCRQMLAYSGKGRFMVRPLDLNEMVKGTWSLLQATVAKKAELVVSPAVQVPKIKADGLQLRQLLMNLVQNATEALPEQGGRVAIRTGLMTVDRIWLSGAYLAPDLPEGEYVFLEVEDTGCGMAPEVQAKIFDPFFTTKFTGRGLGLAAVAGIVRAHGGAIRVNSQPGHGSTFRVVFAPAPEVPPAPEKPAAVPVMPQGRGAVLVVDDEETIRQVAAQVLAKAGYDAVTAVDGVHALEVLAANQRDFRIVLLDFSMPRLDGVETFKRLREKYRDLPVVLMSGYDEQDAVERFSGLGLLGFVQKPFTPAVLLETIRRAAK